MTEFVFRGWVDPKTDIKELIQWLPGKPLVLRCDTGKVVGSVKDVEHIKNRDILGTAVVTDDEAAELYKKFPQPVFIVSCPDDSV
jgi:hypothetical protein